jgi:hypothetical protein
MKLEPIYKARVEAAGMPGGIGAAKLAELDRMEQDILRSAGGGGGSFTVTAGGKTYTFPSQEAANKFKAEAGVK